MFTKPTAPGSFLKTAGYRPFLYVHDWEKAWTELDLPILDHRECHVWAVRLDQSPQCVAAIQPNLSRSETERAVRFHAKKDAERFVVAHGLLRILTAGYLARKPAEIEFEYSTLGKPSVLGSDLRLSKSTSQELGVFAFCRGAELGVDVEAHQAFERLKHSQSLLFSEEEQSQTSSADQTQLHSMFFRGWTRKEAVLKALGLGLTVPPDQLSVSLGGSAEFSLSFAPENLSTFGTEWSLRSWVPIPGYEAALAIRAAAYRVSFYCPVPA